MAAQGYYRYPSIFKNLLVFTCEDDLWEVDLEGKSPARRLTNHVGNETHAAFSPDGKYIAFSATLEGYQEVYLLDRSTGSVKRLTYFGDICMVVGWRDNETVLFSSSAHQPVSRFYCLYEVHISGSQPVIIPETVSCQWISIGSGKKSVLQRHGYREYAYWKRYRGGTAGQVWIDSKGDGNFKKLHLDNADCARPMWLGSRIYFISDHEGTGNLYSCNAEGKDIRAETTHHDFYVRQASTDGKSIVYSSGGDLYRFDVAKRKTTKLDFTFHSPRTLGESRYADVEPYLQDFDIHPKGHHIAATSRGKAFVMGTFEGPTYLLDPNKKGRFRLSRWLSDGKRIVVVNDVSGEESLELYDAEELKLISAAPAFAKTGPSEQSSPLGRVVEMITNPKTDHILIANHRGEVLVVDIKGWKIHRVDRSEYGPVRGLCWSPDGEWFAYGVTITQHQSVIKIGKTKSKAVHTVTKPVLQDACPSFDPEGKYLYFVSYRNFEAVWDSLHFELSFPFGGKLYAILLQNDLDNPFVDRPEKLEIKKDKKKKKDSEKDEDAPVKVKIDFQGIENRICPVPVPAGLFDQIFGVKGKVLFTQWVPQPSIYDDEPSRGASLICYDLDTKRTETIVNDVTEIYLSHDAQTIIYANDEAVLRVIKTSEKPEESDDTPGKKTGWVDMDRFKVRVNPMAEWQQIFNETWRLQRDHFWTADMSKLDWKKIYDRYHPLVARIGSRAELSDLLWEIQGELGTSHAYVFGGDVPRTPKYVVGKLGADLSYEPKDKAYKVTKLYPGDIWQPGSGSPLCHPGVALQVGDSILSINGQELTQERTPAEVLLYQADTDVRLTVLRKGKNKTENLIVRTLRNELAARYRSWVEEKREYVHKITNGKVGYIHTPDMGLWGYCEFHRGFLAECDRDALILDVRFNGGGMVSPLILEKLSRKRLGYDVSRWWGSIPYPSDSPTGAMVALTNEYAGSDGDIFSHAFKLLGLGPLVGKRTWGGVIGINPSHNLVDRGMTTQPEYSFWFKDAGWSIENYGVEPDIEVEMTPSDYRNGHDPQLDRAIQEALKQIKLKPKLEVDFSSRPDLRKWLNKKPK